MGNRIKKFIKEFDEDDNVWVWKKKMVETGSLKSLIKQDKISTNFLNYLAV